MAQRRAEKCKCGWPWVGFHICVDLSKPHPMEGVIQTPTSRRSGGRQGTTSDMWTNDRREAMAEIMREKWAKIHEKNRPRDEKIVARYNEGTCGVLQLAEEFGLGKAQVTQILKRYEDMGYTELRKKGQTINSPAARAAQRKEENRERDAEIGRLYRDDHIGMIDLGKRYGISATTIREILIEQKIEIRPRGRNSRWRRRQVAGV